jgi:hypothetical protein
VPELAEAAFDAVAVLVGEGVIRDGDLAGAVDGISALALMRAIAEREALLSWALSAKTALPS